VLVVAQVALSMVLLTAAGMLLEGLRRSVGMNPGFRTDRLMMMSTDTSLVRYTPAQTHDFYRNLADRARALPGIASVALTSTIPMNVGDQITHAVIPEGYQLPQGEESVSEFGAVVDEHYFDTMKTEIVRGRAFTADGSRLVAIVNEEFAKTYWPNLDPIGKRVRLETSQSPWLEVVGLTQDRQILVHQRAAEALSLSPVRAARAGSHVTTGGSLGRRSGGARRAAARLGSEPRCEPAGFRSSDDAELLRTAGTRSATAADAHDRLDGLSRIGPRARRPLRTGGILEPQRALWEVQFEITVPALEDKIVQKATVTLLNAIYEQDFLPCS
jgi:hypothetical protein